jgi:hypothetical protein
MMVLEESTRNAKNQGNGDDSDHQPSATGSLGTLSCARLGPFHVPRFFPLSTKAINLTTTRHVYVHEVIRPIDVNELHM